jgi:hypothetical protein
MALVWLFAILLAIACEEKTALTGPPGGDDDDDDGGGGIPTAVCGGFPSVGPAGVIAGVAGTGDIRVNPSVTYQTIVGWEAHGQAGEDDDPDFALYADSLLVRAACDLGINRIRLEVQSGQENPTDNYLRMRAGEITNEQWRCLRWTAVNDNTDPNSINASGFNWTLLDRRIERVILPLRKLMQDRGERLYINLTYVAFVEQCNNLNYIHANPAEYAEFMLAAFTHLRDRWGIVPDGLEVILEPDNSDWDGTDIGRAIVQTAARLEAAGFRPEFIGPSTTSMARAITFFDDMIRVQGVSQYLKEISYHRYTGVSTSNLQQLATRAAQHNMRTAMLEKLDADYTVLHQDLKFGRVSAWQQFALAFRGDGAGGNVYLGIDRSSGTPRIIYPARTRFLRQYFQFIREGARRIDATSTKSAFDPVAFINPDGDHVVVVKATAGGSFTVQGLPAARYGVKYTTAAEFDVDLPDVNLGAGETLSASIPAAGAVTIFER